jgi:hypothetical protein
VISASFHILPIIPFACPYEVPSPVPNLVVDRNVGSKGAEFCDLGLLTIYAQHYSAARDSVVSGNSQYFIYIIASKLAQGYAK